MQRPAHYSPEWPNYNYPMIPFCWFGTPLFFIGNYTANLDKQSYNGSVLVDPRKTLRWCDIFKPTFPMRTNCFTVNGNQSTTSLF